MTEHVLIVGGGSDLQRRLRVERGATTSVLCSAEVLTFVPEPGENHAVVLLPKGAPESDWLHFARSIHESLPVTRVASLAEIDQDKAAAVAAALGLDFHAAGTVRWVHDKVGMRARLAEAGVERIPNAIVRNPDDVVARASEWGYPIVLKPSRGRASTGVSIVSRAEDAPRAFARSSGATAPRLDPSEIVAEPMLVGNEVSAESISEGDEHVVVAITQKHTDEATRVEIGQVVPATLPDDTVASIHEHVARVLSALDVRAGVTHTELFLCDDGPHTVETHLRPAGDEIPELVHDATGVDMLDALLRQVVGERVVADVRARLRAEELRGAAIWYVTSDVPGELLGVDGVDEARAQPGVRDVQVLLGPGAQVGDLISSYSRVAFVRARGHDAGDALRRARSAAASLRVRVAASDARATEAAS